MGSRHTKRSGAAEQVPARRASSPHSLRYAVLDLSAATESPSVAGFQGKVLYRSHARALAQAMARKRMAGGDVFVVLIDTVSGRQLFPACESGGPRGQHATRSGVRRAVSSCAGSTSPPPQAPRGGGGWTPSN